MAATATPALAAGTHVAAPQAASARAAVDPFSRTHLDINPNPARVGQEVTLTAHVACFFRFSGHFAGFPVGEPVNFSASINGNDTFLGSADIDGGGDATLPVQDLPAGTHVITATFDGARLHHRGFCSGSDDSDTIHVFRRHGRPNIHIHIHVNVHIGHIHITKIGSIKITHIVVVNNHRCHKRMAKIMVHPRPVPVTGL